MAGQMLYKLEYILGWKSSSDPGVFVHLKVNPPVFKKFTPIEDITAEDHTFIKQLGVIPGVTDVYSSAYRVFVQKAPVFRWDEVIPSLLNTIQNALGFSSRAELEPAVGGDGYGATPLDDKSHRRDWPL